ncbi:MAG TPA: class GN sortase [Burkholderiales bacterium]|nr:class GN sortase [Burkholderiales bacterium]
MKRDQELCLGVECAWPESNAGTRSKSVGRLRLVLVALLVATGGWQFARGAWIQAKAWIAQALIAQAWQRTLAGETHARPWPWADTWPVARLSVPSLGIERYVLEGADGVAMAFGPGHLAGTALPGASGNSVISGHRDTHFAFLRKLALGTKIIVQTPDGARHAYTVRRMRVLDRSDAWVAAQEGPARLTLVTCFPFDALRAGGPGRYVVWAYPIDEHKDRGGERADRTSHLL